MRAKSEDNEKWKKECRETGEHTKAKLSGCVAHEGHARSPRVVFIARRGATHS